MLLPVTLFQLESGFPLASNTAGPTTVGTACCLLNVITAPFITSVSVSVKAGLTCVPVTTMSLYAVSCLLRVTVVPAMFATVPYTSIGVSVAIGVIASINGDTSVSPVKFVLHSYSCPCIRTFSPFL